jgi:hypothetical protein
MAQRQGLRGESSNRGEEEEGEVTSKI